MVRAKKFFALLLCAALFAALATPAFAQEFAPTQSYVTVTADKKMVATGESITLTVAGIPPLEAGQAIQYNWWVKYGAVDGPAPGTTTEPVLRTQVHGREVVPRFYSSMINHKFPITYSCQARVTDGPGSIVAYYNGEIEVQGYYKLADGIAVPYEYLKEALAYMLFVPGLVFYEPMLFFTSVACLFGILWSPFVALANSMEARRVNG